MQTRAKINEALDLAWAAGFLDGEGCLSISKCTHKKRVMDGNLRDYYSCTITAAQVKIKPLEKLHAMFGGALREINTSHGKAWEWRTYSANTVNVLQQILPYLVLKKEQAELILEFQATIGPSGRAKVSDKIYEKRIRLYSAVKALNVRRTRTPGHAERLNESGSVQTDHAIVRSHGNDNHESLPEMKQTA